MNELQKFTLEFPIEISSKLLYTMISTPEGLTHWFADSVIVEEDIFHFRWHDTLQTARLVQHKDNEYVKFEWLDDFHQGLHLEMQVIHEPLSTGVTLMVTDFAETGELELTQRLWQTQVGHLKRIFNS